jgi:hypothetical protein
VKIGMETSYIETDMGTPRVVKSISGQFGSNI